MTLSDVGESRVRGYLYVLERSLLASHSAQLATDAVREVESHIRERVAESQGMPSEREALEVILARLGTPSTVARAYSLEMIMEEAEIGGRMVAVLRSLFHTATASVKGFVGALVFFTGYAVGAGFVTTALLKPIFPHNVGFWWYEGGMSLGAQFPPPPGVSPLGGYWIVPIFLVLGLGVLLLTHRAARRWIANLRTHRLSRATPA